MFLSIRVEGEVEWYMCYGCIHSCGRGGRMIYMCFVVSVHVEGEVEWYMCVVFLSIRVEGEVERYTCVLLYPFVWKGRSNDIRVFCCIHSCGEEGRMVYIRYEWYIRVIYVNICVLCSCFGHVACVRSCRHHKL